MDECNFIYRTKAGTTKGYFNVYQSRNGGIFLQMGDRFTLLSKTQVENDLSIDVYDLIDFDLTDYKQFYEG